MTTILRRLLGVSDHDAAATLAAFSRSQGIIEFALDGTILGANDNFLKTMGYTLAEIKGRHHRMFVDPAEAQSPDYAEFWRRLCRGEHDAAEYKRIAKGGREVWIQASYNPVLDRHGKPCKVVKIAADVTARKLAAADAQSQLAAIGRVQAVIEFNLDGTILTANENFCRAMGYGLDEIVGHHHRMFVDPAYAQSADYAAFWDTLRRGESLAAEYRRLGKNGREVWIQASYNPIFDVSGRPYKVVKYATDATDATARKEAVKVLGAHLSRLADGDLTAVIDDAFKGDLEKVRVAYNGTVATMRDIVRRLRTASSSLKTATGEILSGANDLADRTTKQAAAVEETSAALEQLSTTVGDNAARAASASAKAKAVSVTASEANGVMTEANDAMERISASSTKISNIIGLIDDIAFQTNLLALNASVEAARAGDAGKGFAVVAIEVRRLAQSAAGASSEVKALIEQSSGEVATGSRKVAEATQKVTAMLEGIHENGVLIEQITRATSEQSGAIVELTSAVKQVDEMTQHNAALVEETNAAIEQTEGQASELDRIVDTFVLEDGGRGAPEAARQHPPATRPPRGKAAAAARVYLAEGNAALKREDWTEF
ncbi:MAG: chemotaxis protein [Devosia sp. 67-54]|uniref:methyl-accepting chemotaxis protein n=1 Tax=unclassified Devosia TaxID=196773 RepID=UPI00095C91B8|nr:MULTISPECIES: methyl-accepting chemotaxis protein [unclassified Devosia]MBN9306271.1 PAS domain-containing protein [Devosia sp.]OJX18343.1 MAG: chemotaxis protein [Devosia sp. 67-54]